MCQGSRLRTRACVADARSVVIVRADVIAGWMVGASFVASGDHILCLRGQGYIDRVAINMGIVLCLAGSLNVDILLGIDSKVTMFKKYWMPQP